MTIHFKFLIYFTQHQLRLKLFGPSNNTFKMFIAILVNLQYLDKDIACYSCQNYFLKIIHFANLSIQQDDNEAVVGFETVSSLSLFRVEEVGGFPSPLQGVQSVPTVQVYSLFLPCRCTVYTCTVGTLNIVRE